MKRKAKISQLIFTSLFLVFSSVTNIFTTPKIAKATESMPAMGSLGLNGAIVGDGSRVEVQSGSFENPGDVLVTKIVEKTETLGKYKVTFNIKGRPTQKDTTVEKPVYAVVVLDKSISMSQYSHTKWEKAKQGARDFASTLLGRIPTAQIALVGFSQNISTLREFSSTDFSGVNFGNTAQGTNLGGGLARANALMSTVSDSDAFKYIVVIGDGEPNCYIRSGSVSCSNSYGTQGAAYANTEANALKAAGYTIYSIGYEVARNSTAENVLKGISTSSDHYFSANADAVAEALKNIAGNISEVNAGTDAAISDGIGTSFKLESSDAYGGTKTINIDGEITEDGITTAPFYININETAPTGWHETNAGFELTYTDANGNPQVIEGTENPQVYWESYNYATEYYYDGTKDASATETGTAMKGAIISDYTNKPKTGYMFSEVKNLPLTVNSDESKNIIEVHYVADPSQVKRLSYTVEYYLDDNTTPEDSETETTTVQILEPDTLTVNKSKINTTDKYPGYKLEKTNPSPIPDTIDDGGIIKIYFELNSFAYKIHHLEEGTNKILAPEETALAKFGTTKLVEETTITGYSYKDKTKDQIIISEKASDNEATVYYVVNSYDYQIQHVVKEEDGGQILDEEFGSANFGEAVPVEPKEFDGYKPAGQDKDKIIIDTKNNIATVLYEIDEAQTVPVGYLVEYYKDGIKQTDDTMVVTDKVQVLAKKELAFVDSSVDTDKYEGYTFQGTDPETIPAMIEDGTTIKVYYTVNQYGYEVTHEEKGNPGNILGTDSDLANFGATIVVTPTDFFGYKYDSQNKDAIDITTNSSANTATVYYVIDEEQTKEISYIVEYWLDDELIETEKITTTVQVLDPEVVPVNPEDINTEDKFEDSVFVGTDPEELPEEIAAGETIHVFYEHGKGEEVVPEPEILPPHTGIEKHGTPNYFLLILAVLNLCFIFRGTKR